MYPDSALSAGQLAIMAVFVTASLAAWLVLVFLAARQPRGTSAAVNAGPRDEETAATVTQLPPGASPADKAAALPGKAPWGVHVHHHGGPADSRVTEGRTDSCQLHDHLEV